jgi:hypothetical protein
LIAVPPPDPASDGILLLDRATAKPLTVDARREAGVAPHGQLGNDALCKPPRTEVRPESQVSLL